MSERRPGEIAIAPGSGLSKARRCTCWPRPDGTGPCTPQTCDGRCLACRIHGRPFYSYGDLQYLEHGTGPLAAELDRLGLVPRRPHLRPVTELYYPDLQDPPPDHDGRNAGRCGPSAWTGC